MTTTLKMKRLYNEIQQKLFYMIPEKWDRIYLYASVIEGMNNLETGEMFFYYFPKGILKKDPINVYEVPIKFNIEDSKYFKLADELYGVIKKLREEYYEINKKAWSNITISIENFKFIVEYDFTDLVNSAYSSYDRHLVFRYKYLKTGINTYNKKERSIILEYMENEDAKQDEMKDTYIEGIYKTSTHNVIDYEKEENENMYQKEETNKIEKEIKEEKIEMKEKSKNQILNFDRKDTQN